MSESLLTIKDLHVQYNTDEAVVHALNGINLTLKKGEALGLVGETGAGKTTMALSILQLLPAKVGEITKGNIHYDNTDILAADNHNMRKIRGAKIAMIFQDPMSSLNPILTVGDQIHEVLELHFPEMSREEKDQRVDDILGLVGIQKSRKNEYPHQFSGGMKQRIGIAMALVAEPELLLADEPTTALDVTIQAQILQLMQELQKKFNTSMIFITHDLGVVAEFCENVSVVYAGEIIETGSVEEVFARKRNHPYTVGLFNSIPDLTTEAKRLIPIPGFMTDPTNLPVGCKFVERCPNCMEKCKVQLPPMFGAGHKIKCFLYEDRGGNA
ncbi:ABC transporter ATP-binding protein [Marasmitruncus massiliensis]|uniref:ABC transporter ATP-binding protein n=1 Tax=Marasmitruncus massiliensis TaxID=1944642 RepID=UPI000C79B2A3|nr:ABC transporter ATP-binding protein [Marasmitruncus massiliensis]